MEDAYYVVIAVACGFFFVAFIFYTIYKTSVKYKKASTALGDTTHTTGVPNFPWKKLNISYLEYQMVLQALANSGDFSPENVKHCLSGVDYNNPGRFILDDHSNGGNRFAKHKQHENADFPDRTQSVGHDDDNDHGSNFSDPFSTDNLSPTNVFLGDSLHITSNDALSHYHHESDFGRTSGSDF